MLPVALPRDENSSIGPSGLLIAAICFPSGDRSMAQKLTLGSRLSRKISESRPFTGSKAVKVTCLPSALGSATAHLSDEDLVHKGTLPGLTGKTGCGVPPVSGTRMSSGNLVASP